MSSFQHLSSIICWSRVHHAAWLGSVNFCVPTTASLRSLIEASDCDSRIENSQPPNQPSLTPPAIGVMPFGSAAWCRRSGTAPTWSAAAMSHLARTSLR